MGHRLLFCVRNIGHIVLFCLRNIGHLVLFCLRNIGHHALRIRAAPTNPTKAVGRACNVFFRTWLHE